MIKLLICSFLEPKGERVILYAAAWKSMSHQCLIANVLLLASILWNANIRIFQRCNGPWLFEISLSKQIKVMIAIGQRRPLLMWNVALESCIWNFILYQGNPCYEKLFEWGYKINWKSMFNGIIFHREDNHLLLLSFVILLICV